MTQFPQHPVKGSYDEAKPSPRLKFNERDAASVAATTALTQPIIVVASALETVAFNVDGLAATATPSFTASFVTMWLVQTIAVALLKTIACLLRNYGTSLFRDLVAWAWRWWIIETWNAFRGMARSLWPTRRRRPPDNPQPPSPGRRRPVRDAIRRRRGDQ